MKLWNDKLVEDLQNTAMMSDESRHSAVETMHITTHGRVSLTVVKINRTPVTSFDSCTEYEPISVIFGLENHQRFFSLQVK